MIKQNIYGWMANSFPGATRMCMYCRTPCITDLVFLKEPAVISSWRVQGDSSGPDGPLKRLWLRRNDMARPLKPDFRRRTGYEASEPILAASRNVGLCVGPTNVLVTVDGQTRMRTILTESMGIGSGRNRNIIGFHYIARPAQT